MPGLRGCTYMNMYELKFHRSQLYPSPILTSILKSRRTLTSFTLVDLIASSSERFHRSLNIQLPQLGAGTRLMAARDHLHLVDSG